ncbi:MAG: hypothetical protein KKA22_00425 [Gammaproteobacteria bacterium]|nr:hypothetical protein [Gammaproteobacteria bacterium]MBU1406598.1 hypothetical protein [Gammaproteobacteria bacterium]MBU1530906.1 hypothetical protein [Gammaproteobacteria bacterium]
MKTNRLGVILAVIAGFAAVTNAVAGNPKSGCDVVTLSGSGTRSESGVIVGSSTLTLVATSEQIPVTFTAVPLGITDFLEGKATFVSSHEFKGVDNRRVNFTTFDEIKTVPLQGDPSCGQGECGLVFKLVLETGIGDYNCGEIVSGYDPTLTSFTSTLQGNTLQLNSVGKLCKCRLSGNN